MDLTFMQERLDIRSMIHEGELNKAINKVKDIDAKVLVLYKRCWSNLYYVMQILEENVDLNFTLQLQKLIELIKQNNVMEALDFAQKEIAPFMEKSVIYFSL